MTGHGNYEIPEGKPTDIYGAGFTVRAESPEDTEGIGAVHRLAFAQDDEADLVKRLRSNGKVILSLVAIDQGRVVGNTLFTPARIRAQDGVETPAVALGPVAVLPERQKQGIGSSMIRAGLAQMTETGPGICILLGHPEYYPRFGFEPASRYGIRCQWQVPEPAFMVLALQDGGLDGVTGTAYYAPEFDAE